MNRNLISFVVFGGSFLIAVFFILNKDNSVKTVSSLKVPSWKIKKALKTNSDSATSSNQNEHKPSGVNSEGASSLPVLDPYRGLCFFTNLGTEKYLPLSLVRHLSQNSPSSLIIPSIHGDCLKETENFQFSIVDYDPFSDVAFNFFGKIKLSLKLEQEFSSYEEMIRVEPEAYKRFGFKDPKEMSNYFADQGYHRFLNKGLISFKVNEYSKPLPRDKSAVYDVYPGVDFISFSEAERRSTASIITMLRPGSSFGSSLKGINDQFQSLSFRKIEPPRQVRLSLPSKMLSPLPKDREVIILGLHSGDQRPLNLASALIERGFSKVSVIKGGIYESNGFRTETPNSVLGLKALSVGEFFSAVQSSLVIDTRRAKLDSPFKIQGSFLVPYSFPPEMDFSHSFFQSFGSGDLTIRPFLKPERFLSLPNLKMYLSGKSVMVVGANEFDWSPVIIGLYIKQNLKVSVSWFRSGFDRLENLHRLGLSTDEISSAKVATSPEWEEMSVDKSENSRVIFLSTPKGASHELIPKIQQVSSP
jgi:hypothetical protein